VIRVLTPYLGQRFVLIRIDPASRRFPAREGPMMGRAGKPVQKRFLLGSSEIRAGKNRNCRGLATSSVIRRMQVMQAKNVSAAVSLWNRRRRIGVISIGFANPTVRTRKQRGCAMERRRQSVPHIIEDQIAAEKARLEAQFADAPPGPQKDALLKKIRRLETASHMYEWLSSPGLQPPTLA
jgi:hypothetical protein